MSRIRTENDPVLSTICTEFPPGEKSEWIDDLIRTCKKAKTAVGLAAPQIGVAKRVFYLYCQDEHGSVRGEIIINPQITWISDTWVEDREGCMSFPGIFKIISRPQEIEATWESWPTRRTITKKLHGYRCRVFLHEFDHLDGICLVGHPDAQSKYGKLIGEVPEEKKGNASLAMAVATIAAITPLW